ncbi:patatin-like phospholipase domain-containing protein 2 [Anneissia japonica]|uniref:patatin-like phospholipase domain-containing protein 2 n=1 Tax=Anneissia japonica TaxID=1529436 RepID=UPI00142569F9|nr:patatin-like phospholipase domain-containing protein 2 [Anneissia japonica]
MEVSFAGCGFLGVYHIGVASAFRQYAPHLIQKACGASAGALAACILTCDMELGSITQDVLNMARRARSRTLGPLHPSFNIQQILKDGLIRVLPFDAYKKVSGNIFISLTRLSDRKNVIISEFDSNEDLIQVLLCSAFIPFYSGIIPPSYKGVKYVDGGISDNLPSLGDDTITVSPFSGESDICPPSDDFSSYLQLSLSNTYIQITPSNLYRLSRALFPPDPEILRKMCEQGFDDTLKYLQKNTIIPCNKHIEHYRSASVPSIDITPQQQKEIRKYYTSLPRHASTPNIRIGPYQQNPPQKPQEEDMQQEDTPRDMQRQPQQRNRCNSEGTNRDNNNDFTLPRSFFGDELTDICEKEELWLEWTDEDFFSEDEVDGEDDSTYHCEDCRKHTHHLKVIKKLPPPVIAALEEASNSVNKGLMNYIYNNRIYQAISLFTLPYILPIETALTYSVRFAKWLPYLPADSQWFLCGLGSLIKYIIGNLNSGRHEFSARFSCQLAVTEDLLKPLAGYPVTSVGHASAITDCDTCSIEALDIATSPKKRHNFNFRFAMEMTSDLPDSVLESFDMCEDVFTPSHPLPTSHINEPCSVACDTFDYTLRMTDEMDSSAANHYLHVTQTVNHETNESHVSVQEV